MRYRLKRIHKQDAYYDDRKRLVGQTFTANDVRPTQGLPGYSIVGEGHFDDTRSRCFYAVKIEEAEEVVDINRLDTNHV
jgi:hypothetical protein